MLICAKTTSILHLRVLIRIACVFAVLLSAGCGDRGGGYIIEPGTGGPCPVADTTPPAVFTTSPGANAASIPVNTSINVSFSEHIAPATVTDETIRLKDNADQTINAAVNCSGSSITLTPASWLSINTIYTVIVTTGITDLNGNHLTGAFQWTFTTNSQADPVPPTISATSPSHEQTDVALSTSITITFSEAIKPATATDSNVTLKDMWGVPVNVDLSVNGTTLVVSPTSTLKFNMTYYVSITTGVTDMAGNALPDIQWLRFKTVENTGFFKPYLAIPTGSWPEAVAIGDVTGDGKNDVVLATSFYFDPAHDFHVFLFAQDPQGGLATAITCTTSGSNGNMPMSVAIGDINNDGKNEIVVGLDRSNIEIFSYTGAGALASIATYTSEDTSWIKIADLNHDGLLDVVGIGWGTNTASVFLQNVGGTFNAPVTYAVMHGGWDDIDVGDINNDGLTDIIVMSGQGASPNIGVLIQKSDGTFDQAVYYDLGGAGGIAVGDVNNDGRNDLVLPNKSGSSPELAVFLQNPEGTLEAPTLYSIVYYTTAVEVADINGDGRKDVVIWPASPCLQTADGALSGCESYTVPSVSSGPQGIAIGDINSDGKPDIALAGIDDGLVILYHY